jgi:hypothetical protein
VGLRVAADATERLLWLLEQAAALIEADGLDVDAGLFCQLADRRLGGHLDSVLDYGSKVTLVSKIAPGASRDGTNEVNLEKREVIVTYDDAKTKSW